MPIKTEDQDSRSTSISSTRSIATFATDTPTTTANALNEDPTSVPWPGNTYIITQADSCGILNVKHNKLYLGMEGKTTNDRWRIEEDPASGLLTLQNEGTGLYLWMNSLRKMGLMNVRHPNEGFIPMRHVEGGYVLKWWDGDRRQMRAVYEDQEMVRLKFTKV